MDLGNNESICLSSPDFSDALVQCEAFERLQTTGVGLCIQKVGEVTAQPFVAVEVGTFDGGVPDGAVHAFNLTVGPRVVQFDQPMFNDLAP